ncbi:MAG: hypothetical protein AAGC43_18520, partial [Bacteroidota bacterium]
YPALNRNASRPLWRFYPTGLGHHPDDSPVSYRHNFDMELKKGKRLIAAIFKLSKIATKTEVNLTTQLL